jgi:hypothetical protein
MADVKIFSVQSDIESVQKTFASLGDNIKHKFLPFAINQVGSKAFTKSVRMTADIIGVPRKNLLHGSAGKAGDSSKPIMTKKQSKSKNLAFEIKVKSRWLHISEDYFNPIQTKAGVKSTYYNQRYTHKGSWLGKGKYSGKTLAYLPTGKTKMVQGKRKMIKRSILKALWAFNPAREFMKARLSETILNEFAPQIKQRYEDKLNQYIAKHQGKMKPM